MEIVPLIAADQPLHREQRQPALLGGLAQLPDPHAVSRQLLQHLAPGLEGMVLEALEEALVLEADSHGVGRRGDSRS